MTASGAGGMKRTVALSHGPGSSVQAIERSEAGRSSSTTLKKRSRTGERFDRPAGDLKGRGRGGRGEGAEGDAGAGEVAVGLGLDGHPQPGRDEPEQRLRAAGLEANVRLKPDWRQAVMSAS